MEEKKDIVKRMEEVTTWRPTEQYGVNELVLDMIADGVDEIRRLRKVVGE